MLMIYNNPAIWEAMPGKERERAVAEATALMDELQRSGEWVGGEGLADPSNSRTVRVRHGVPAVTDGPYLEAKEHLAGYCVVECESMERALAIATRWPDARHAGMEVRPLMGGSGLEM
ncbi:YciI family protein [Spongiactinospora sp. TRM90649]|uniref:YciI family protein n=1 Tax=Spongiactinospora sp. TRM90649 TaxID=3031114 RepID=UPI0023FA126D|nr:YciI family protein [Spongiactinospora sp. TRM90649]MDF5758041.1 YciI family protein [Spongiactinospora sp. TRM90649]